MNPTAPADVLIVGGGIAGYTTATTLRDLGFDGAITIVERDASCLDHPPLSKQALIDGSPRADLDFATPDRLAELRIAVVTQVAAVSITLDGVTLSDGRILSAARIVVAIGAAPRRPAVPGSDDPRVITLRGYDDAMRIREASGPNHRVLVMGGGFIGAEVTASLRMLKTEVVLVDPHENPGEAVLGETLASWLRAMHIAHAVDVRTTTVSAIRSHEAGSRPISVELADGSSVTADLVVAGVGVVPRELPGMQLIEPAGGVILRPTAHWESARLDGVDAASRILGHAVAPRGTGWYWSDRYGAHIEVVGELTGDGDDVIRRDVAVFRVMGDRLLGAASIDDPMTIRAARRIIDRGVRVDRAALADPTISLRQMLKA